jgi:hypothetical protein
MDVAIVLVLGGGFILLAYLYVMIKGESTFFKNVERQALNIVHQTQDSIDLEYGIMAFYREGKRVPNFRIYVSTIRRIMTQNNDTRELLVDEQDFTVTVKK